MPSPSIYLVRHAQSAANAGAKTADTVTIPITEIGLQQAQCVADFIPVRPDLVVFSGYLRTQMTASPLLARFHGVPSEQWPIEEFDYLDPATYANTTYSERRGPRGAYWKRCEPLWTDSVASESFAGFIERVGRFDRALSDRGARSTLVVYTHGFVMRALLWPRRHQIREVTSEEMADFYRFHRTIAVPNCGMLVGSVDPNGRLLLPASVSIDHIPQDLRTA